MSLDRAQLDGYIQRMEAAANRGAPPMPARRPEDTNETFAQRRTEYQAQLIAYNNNPIVIIRSQARARVGLPAAGALPAIGNPQRDNYDAEVEAAIGSMRTAALTDAPFNPTNLFQPPNLGAVISNPASLLNPMTWIASLEQLMDRVPMLGQLRRTVGELWNSVTGGGGVGGMDLGGSWQRAGQRMDFERAFAGLPQDRRQAAVDAAMAEYGRDASTNPPGGNPNPSPPLPASQLQAMRDLASSSSPGTVFRGGAAASSIPANVRTALQGAGIDLSNNNTAFVLVPTGNNVMIYTGRTTGINPSTDAPAMEMNRAFRLDANGRLTNVTSTSPAIANPSVRDVDGNPIAVISARLARTPGDGFAVDNESLARLQNDAATITTGLSAQQRQAVGAAITTAAPLLGPLGNISSVMVGSPFPGSVPPLPGGTGGPGGLGD